MAQKLDRFAYLLEPIRDPMAEQRYREWYAVATEHIVRLGEIRIAMAAGDTAHADELRRHHLSERRFIYLPVLERAVERYENDRTLYPTFEAFLPDLVQAFRNVDMPSTKQDSPAAGMRP